MDNVKRIICAAIWYHDEFSPVHGPKNVGTGLVLCGHRHHAILSAYAALRQGVRPGMTTQGFLTSDNFFVNRVQAAKIAFDAGQTATQKGQLTSEDLY